MKIFAPDITGSLNLDGPITASGNISGSSTSTGSFGGIFSSGVSRFTGNVGIKTTNPLYALHVEAGNDLTAKFSNDGDRARLLLNDNDTEGYVIVQNSKFSIGQANSVSTSNLTIDGSGNVGIGHTSPATSLHVATTDGITVSDTATDNTDPTTADGTTDKHLTILRSEIRSHAPTNANANFNIGMKGGNDSGAGALIFQTGNTETERMRIQKDGNVGIGTSSPPHPLTVTGVISGSGTGYFSNIILGGTEQIAVNNGNLYYTGGNLGIGTTTPMASSDGIAGLEIGGSATPGLTIKSTSSSQIYSLWADASDNLNIQDNTNNETRFTINSSGNVGIGTSSPTDKLQIAGNTSVSSSTSGDLDFTVRNTHGTGRSRIIVQNNNTDMNVLLMADDNNNVSMVGSSTGGSKFIKFVGGATNAYFDGGNFGIGTSTPDFKLDVEGDIRATGNIYAENYIVSSSVTSMSFAQNSGSTIFGDSVDDIHQFTGSVNISAASPVVQFFDNDVSNLRHRIIGGGNAGLEIGADIGNVLSSAYIRFDVGNSEKVRIIESGNLGIGLTNPGAKLEVKGADGSNSTENTTLTDSSGNHLFTQLNGGKAYFKYGPVGIGTTTPTHFLEVSASDSGDPVVDIYNTHATNGYGLRVTGGDDNNVYSARFQSVSLNPLMTVWGGGDVEFHAANAKISGSSTSTGSFGRLGVGTSGPTGTITVSKGLASAPLGISASGSYLQLGTNDYGSGATGKFMIGFGYTDNYINTHSPAYIGFEETSTSGDTKGDLTFYTRNVTTDTAPTQRMIIDEDGLVGIGVDPDGILFRAEKSVNGNWAGLIKNTHSTNGYGLKVQGGDDANVESFSVRDVSNTTLFNVLGDGNVGIGTNSPDSKLHVNVGTNQNLEVTSISSKLHLIGTNDARNANIPLVFSFTEFEFEGANAKISGSSTSTGSFGQGHFDGRVGIGIQTPDIAATSLDHLIVGKPGTGVAMSGTSHVGIVIGTGTSHIGRISFLDSLSAFGGAIDYHHGAGSGGVDTLKFYTDNYTERLNLEGNKISGSSTSTGSFGALAIGTSTIEADINFQPAVYTTGGQGIRWQDAVVTTDAIVQGVRQASNVGIGVFIGANSQVDTSGGISRFNTSEESSFISVDPRGDLYFGTGGTGANPSTRMHIDVNGNAGIGVTPESDWLSTRTGLQVGGSGAIFGRTAAGVDGDLRIGENVYQHSGGSYRRISGDEVSMYSQTAGTHTFSVAGSSTDNSTITFTDAMFINNSGQLGIGTISPSRKLSVAGTIHISSSDAPYTSDGWSRYVEIDSKASGGGGIVWKGQSSGISRGVLANQGDMYFARSTADDNSAAPTYDMFIKSTGLVGIGTTNPGQILHISSSGNIKSTIESAGSSAGVQIKSAGEDYNSSLEFLSAGNSNGQIYYDHHATAGSQKMIFQVGDGGVNAITIDGSGNVGIGVTPSYKLNVTSANGINAFFQGDDSNSYFAISSDQSNNSAGYSIVRSDSTTALTFDGHNMNLTIGGSYSPFTAAHTAQLIDDEEYHYGELVQIQGLIQSGKDIVYQVNKTTGSYQRNVLGAFGYVEDSQFNNTAVSRSSADDEFMIYVVGDGHILCNGEKGNIAVGDGICSSTTAGQGMKADKMAMIIGIAQASASFSGSETQLVPVQYGLQQFTPWTD